MGLRGTMWRMRSICIRVRRSFGRSIAKGNVVGVSDDEAGETYWKVANGIRLTGMPSYSHVLTDTQMWQVSAAAEECGQGAAGPGDEDI